MKKIVCAVLTVLMLSSAYAQTIHNPAALKNSRVKFDNSAVQAAKPSKSNNSRGTYQFYLDYAAADEAYASDLGFGFSIYGNNLNSNFNVALPSDTDDNFTLKWAAVKFDTLYDVVEEVSYPLAGATITVDSISFLYQHINTSGLDDTLIVRILEIAGSASGLLSSDQGVTLNNTILWADTTITNTSLTPGLTGGQLDVFTIAPNFTLPVGKGFMVQIVYSGPKEDVLLVVDGNRDECGGSCLASESIFPDNSYGYLNFVQTAANQNLSGIPNLIGLSADCNQNGQVLSEECEFFFLQNFSIWTAVTVDIPLSVSVVQSSVNGCPGLSVPLSVTAVGGTPPYTYSWSNGQSGASINVAVGGTTVTV